MQHATHYKEGQMISGWYATCGANVKSKDRPRTPGLDSLDNSTVDVYKFFSFVQKHFTTLYENHNVLAAHR